MHLSAWSQYTHCKIYFGRGCGYNTINTCITSELPPLSEQGRRQGKQGVQVMEYLGTSRLNCGATDHIRD